MNLYKIKLVGTFRSIKPDCYVVADDPTEAYEEVRRYLDKENLGFTGERCLKSIEQVASDSPDHTGFHTMLFVPSEM